MDEVRAGRVIAIPLIVMMLVAGLGLAAPIVVPPEPESLVEGHTVFTVLEQVNRNAVDREEYGAAVAVLVREICWDERSFRFPGVLWFNDQYLVNPKRASADTSVKYRYPTTGAIIAVPRGDPDPQTVPGAFSAANYVETYHIKDPNDWDWDVDKWVVNGRPVWTVAINNNGAGYATPDNGGSTPQCDFEGSARGDSNLCAGMSVLPWDYENRPSPYNDTPSADRRDRTTCSTPVRNVLGGASAGSRNGEHGYNYPCGGKDTAPKATCSSLQYNGLLFFFLADLTVANTTKNHTAGSTDRANDVSGCASNTPKPGYPDHFSWSCPGGSDAREGNSHAYRPSPSPAQFNSWPWMTSSGRNNHGGSADCTGDGLGDQYCHATRDVDIYYGVAALPPRTPATTVINDREGMTAPYHCHETTNWCNQRDFFEDQGTEDPLQ